MANSTFYKWWTKYGGMDASLMARMKALEDENRLLKKMYAEERFKAIEAFASLHLPIINIKIINTKPIIANYT